MDTGHQEASPLADLAAVLEKLGIGSGRITPRPRGLRLAGETRTRLETAVAEAADDGDAGRSLAYGNACYSLGRHDEASALFRKILASDPADSVARFNLGLVCLRLREPADAVYEFTEVLGPRALFAGGLLPEGQRP